MKIGVILGRGVEGVGVTKNVVEFQKLFPGVEIFATMDKLWPRRESMNFPVTYYRGADWAAVSKPAKKFPNLIATLDVVNRINELDACIIWSIPSKSHSEECIDNFIRMCANINVRKGLVQVDHKMASITRNARLADVCNNVDVLMCHSVENDFARWTQKNNIKTPLTGMGVGFNFNKDYWKPIEEQDARYVRWVGRTAMWKGPDVMIDLHNDHFRKAGFITVLEGLEASIQYPLVLYKNSKELKDRRDVINFFRPEKGLDINETRHPVYGSEQEDMGAYLYSSYTHSEMMERMSLNGFGSDLMYFKKNLYGNNLEYCHTDSFAAGVIPIFHKHLCDNIIHRGQEKPISQCTNSGTIAIDHTNAAKVTYLMTQLRNDNMMRDEMREQMYEFWKDHCSADIVYNDIINKTLSFNKTEDVGLEAFF